MTFVKFFRKMIYFQISIEIDEIQKITIWLLEIEGSILNISISSIKLVMELVLYVMRFQIFEETLKYVQTKVSFYNK